MQYKTLINPSFLVLMLDVQEHIQSGWEIDPNNLPANTFVYYEVNLIKDENQEVFANPAHVLTSEVKNDDFGATTIVQPKKPGRPAQNKAAQ